MSREGYLGLGSNVGDRRANLQAAVDALGGHGVEVLASSSVYDTDPVGEVLDQPDFLNACIRVRTALAPEELLDACKAVERELGRAAGGVRHGPRPIDVDVLLLGDETYRSERLSLPHEQVTSRRFVLVPLLELDADARDPRRWRRCGRLRTAHLRKRERSAAPARRCRFRVSVAIRRELGSHRDEARAPGRTRPLNARRSPTNAGTPPPAPRPGTTGTSAAPAPRRAAPTAAARRPRSSAAAAAPRRSGGRRRSDQPPPSTPSAIQPSTRGRCVSRSPIRSARTVGSVAPLTRAASFATYGALSQRERARDRQLRALEVARGRAGRPRHRRPDHAPRERLQHLVAPLLGALHAPPRVVVRRQQPRRLHAPLQRPQDPARAGLPLPVGELDRRHRGRAEARALRHAVRDGDAARRAGTARP